MKRVLGVVRLSNLTDDTTSPERQRAKVDDWARLHDANVVGYAEDLDVSAITVSPWERKEFKKWLAKPNEYDVIVCWKLDRLARNAKDFVDLLHWADKHGIEIVAVDDGIDLSTDIGRMVAQILAIFAEFEGKTIKARAKAAYDHNIRAGKWRGGFLPYGYRPVKLANGWGLEHDPETSEILRDIVRRIIDGQSANSIIRDLNTRKVPTSLDVQRVRAGKKPKGSMWRVANLLKMLRSKTLLGQYEADGSQYREGTRKVIRGDDGLPIQRAEPLITQAEWEKLQKQLDKNGTGKQGNRTNGAPLLRVAYCARCGRTMTRSPGRTDRYYKCTSRAETSITCRNGGVKATTLESLIDEILMGTIGHLERKTKTYIPGEDHTEDLEQVEAALTELREDRAAGLYRGEKGTAEYRAMYTSLEDQREMFAAMPSRPGRYEYAGAGETFREYWERIDETERGKFLRDSGVRLEVLKWWEKFPVTPGDGMYPELPRVNFGGMETALGEQNPFKAKPKYVVHLGDLGTLYLNATGQDAKDSGNLEWLDASGTGTALADYLKSTKTERAIIIQTTTVKDLESSDGWGQRSLVFHGDSPSPQRPVGRRSVKVGARKR